jgi:hypothetical protein
MYRYGLQKKEDNQTNKEATQTETEVSNTKSKAWWLM